MAEANYNFMIDTLARVIVLEDVMARICAQLENRDLGELRRQMEKQKEDYIESLSDQVFERFGHINVFTKDGN